MKDGFVDSGNSPPNQSKKRGVTYDFLWAARTYAADTLSEKAILFYLIARLDTDGVAYPSQELIAYHLRVDERTIERGIAALKKRGVIVVARKGRNNVYRPVLEAIKEHQLLERLPDEEPETKSPGLRVGKQHPTPMSDDSGAYPTPMTGVEESIPDTEATDTRHESPEYPTQTPRIPDTTHGVRRGRSVEEEKPEETV